jgi:hypothetical protein
MQDHVGTRGPLHCTLLNVNQPWELRFWCKPSSYAEATPPAAVATVSAEAEGAPRPMVSSTAVDGSV